MKTIEVKNRYIRTTIHFLTGEYIKIKDVVEDAVKNNIILTDSDLRGAILTHADLIDAILTHADLTDAILIHTDFTNSVLDDVKVNKHTKINKKTYNTIPDKYKHIFDVCTFVD